MKADYKDIKDKIAQELLWYDMNGVPRYEKFHPSLCSNIYACEVALLRIKCQECDKEFLVSIYWDGFNKMKSISECIDNPSECNIGYGDPPRHGITISETAECLAGDSMGSITIEVIEFWEKTTCPDFFLEWRRIKKYEGVIK